MLVRARPLLGTIVGIKVIADTPAEEMAAAQAAFDAVAEVHRLMSFHEAGSDVSRLNQAAHLAPVAVHPHTYAVLRRACQLSQWSEGLFDCTVADCLMQLGYLPSAGRGALPAPASYRDIMLLTECRVRFLRPLAIDLGGIAKGYAVDLAVTALKNCGARAGLVNAGGDLRGFGERDCPVSVRHPQAPRRTVAIPALRNAAIATTAEYFAARSQRGRPVSPIIDPRTRKSCPEAISVSVIAPCCMDADALTKIIWLSAVPPRHLLDTLNARAIVMGAAASAPLRYTRVRRQHETPLPG